MTGVRITAAPADMDSPLLGGGGAGQAKEDGSFQLKGLSGRRLLRAGNLPPGWTLKAVRLNGEDVTDSGVEFKPRPGRQRARDRRDLEADRDQRHGHGLERLADQGLHRRGLLGRLAALEPARSAAG